MSEFTFRHHRKKFTGTNFSRALNWLFLRPTELKIWVFGVAGNSQRVPYKMLQATKIWLCWEKHILRSPMEDYDGYSPEWLGFRMSFFVSRGNVCVLLLQTIWKVDGVGGYSFKEPNRALVKGRGCDFFRWLIFARLTWWLVNRAWLL